MSNNCFVGFTVIPFLYLSPLITLIISGLREVEGVFPESVVHRDGGPPLLRGTQHRGGGGPGRGCGDALLDPEVPGDG